jgi:prepilin-type N-terminal cleavage/methylation domain-containing protein
MLNGRRRGFTLVELMVATVSTVLAAGTIYQTVRVTQRATRAQAEQLRVQSSVRGAVLAVANELRELSALEGGTGAQNDILSIGPSAIAYRAMRGIGFTCSPSSTDQLRIHRTGFSGFRDPQAGRDSVLVYAGEADSTPAASWISLPVTRVTVATACPGSLPGLTLTLGPAAFLSGRPAGTPVRVYEHMELRMYASEGKFWLGTRSLGTGEVIQPLFGPLSDDDDGFRLSYLDRSGRPTGSPTAIRSIGVSVHGVGDGVDERLSTEVALRNVEQRSE